MRLELALLAIVLAACASTPAPPKCAVENPWGVVRAATPAAAERLSAHVLWLAPRVTAAVPGLTSRQVDARFVEGMHLEGMSAGIAKWVAGTTISIGRERWIELPEGGGEERQVLAHELVHFWIGPDWGTLPYFLEEGLAENVRDSLVPAGYAHASLERAMILGSALFGGLILDAKGRAVRCGSWNDLKNPGESAEVVLFAPERIALPTAISSSAGGAWFSTDRRALPTAREMLGVGRDALRTVRDPQAYAVMFCYGYLLVARIGVDRLHALCLRARASGRKVVPPEWLLESAGLPADDLEAWDRAIVELQRGAG